MLESTWSGNPWAVLPIWISAKVDFSTSLANTYTSGMGILNYGGTRKPDGQASTDVYTTTWWSMEITENTVLKGSDGLWENNDTVGGMASLPSYVLLLEGNFLSEEEAGAELGCQDWGRAWTLQLWCVQDQPRSFGPSLRTTALEWICIYSDSGALQLADTGLTPSRKELLLLLLFVIPFRFVSEGIGTVAL